MRDQDAEIRQSPSSRQRDGHGIGGRGRLETDREEDNLPAGVGGRESDGVERRINDPDVAPPRLQLQEVAPRAGNPQHIAERAEDHVGPFAIACARSIISSAVTQTGQPGPCTSSTPGGRMHRARYLTIVCVWPPQTSMMVQGRVTVPHDRADQLRGGRAVAIFGRDTSW